jgi:hypothetical protein
VRPLEVELDERRRAAVGSVGALTATVRASKSIHGVRRGRRARGRGGCARPDEALDGRVARAPESVAALRWAVGLNRATAAEAIGGQVRTIVVNHGILLKIARSDSTCFESFIDFDEQVWVFDLAVDASKGRSARASRWRRVGARHGLRLAAVIVEVRHRSAEPRLGLLRSWSVRHLGGSGGDELDSKGSSFSLIKPGLLL